MSSSDGGEKMDVDKASTPSNHITEIIELEEGEIVEEEGTIVFNFHLFYYLRIQEKSGEKLF